MKDYFNDTVSLETLKLLAAENISSIDFNRIKKHNLLEFKKLDKSCIDFIDSCHRNHMSKEMILFWDSFYQIRERYVRGWAEYMSIKNVDEIMDILNEIQEVFVKTGSLYLIVHAAINRDQLDKAFNFDKSKNEFEGSLKVIEILDTLFNFNPIESTKNAIKINNDLNLDNIDYDLESIIYPSSIPTNRQITIRQLWKLITDTIIPGSKFVRFFKK
ncbi:hypothetical protein KKG71_02995 [Patescibacteria group bacterium]|nr:hypothetical protein [Patescibacteria group bacterium]